jgi:hypothetical protein
MPRLAPHPDMIWPILIWAAVVSGACFLAVALLVGEAFRRTGPDQSPGKMLASFILFPGLKLAPDAGPAAILSIAWSAWFAAGAAVIAIVTQFG